MQLNTLKPAEGSKKAKVRVGRGWSSGLGKTSGRGVKGQRARGKGKVAIGFEGGQMPFHRRIPKSGFTSRSKGTHAELRLNDFNHIEEPVIDLLVLKDYDIVSENTLSAKVILSGELTRAVVLRGISASKGAIAAIEAKGGKVEA